MVKKANIFFKKPKRSIRTVILLLLFLSQITFSNSENTVEPPARVNKPEDSYLQKAKVHLATKEYTQAIENFKQALEINPQSFRAHFYLANLFCSQNQHKHAQKHYHAAIDINPYIPEVYFNLGILYETEKNIDQAIKNYKQCIEIKPEYFKALIQLGKLLKNKKKYYQAISYLSRALKIEQDNYQANYHLGKIYYEIDLLDQALYYLEQAILKNPQNPIALTDYGNILNMTNKTEQALVIYEQILQLVPTEPSANYNYAYTLKKLKRMDEAFFYYDKALKLAPEIPYINFGVAIAYLTYGNFIKGFKAYEWRWKTGRLTPRNFDKPIWDGSSLENKILFLHAEQGLGDTFQFIRYAKVAKDMGAYVIFAAPTALQKIISLCPYIDQVIPLTKKPLNFDYHAPLMSMPFLCNTTVYNVPCPIPYLYTNKDLVTYWENYTTNTTQKNNFKIGLCWQGNKKHSTKFLTHVFATKSMKLKHFAPLGQLAQVSLYSLQKTPDQKELEKIDFDIHIFDKDFDEKNGRFMDTAAVIKNLDLVITVDTSVAHLAGGLGIETWIILPEPADWRWMQDRLDTPWYPTVKLFRQKESGNWDTVIQEVTNKLKNKLKQFNSKNREFNG